MHVGFDRSACADDRIDIARRSPSLGIVWHCEVRDGLLAMKMSLFVCPLTPHCTS